METRCDAACTRRAREELCPSQMPEDGLNVLKRNAWTFSPLMPDISDAAYDDIVRIKNHIGASAGRVAFARR